MSLNQAVQDAEDVAKGIREGSKGKIKCGVYHAAIPDAQKEGLHEAWKAGRVKVVCATVGASCTVKISFRSSSTLRLTPLSSVWARH